MACIEIAGTLASGRPVGTGNSESIDTPKEAGEDAGDPADYLIARILKLTAMEFIRRKHQRVPNCRCE